MIQELLWRERHPTYFLWCSSKIIDNSLQFTTTLKDLHLMQEGFRLKKMHNSVAPEVHFFCLLLLVPLRMEVERPFSASPILLTTTTFLQNDHDPACMGHDYFRDNCEKKHNSQGNACFLALNEDELFFNFAGLLTLP